MDTCWHTISEWTIEFLAEVPFGIGIFGKSGNAGNVGDVYGNVCGNVWEGERPKLNSLLVLGGVIWFIYIYMCVCVLWCVMGMKRSSIHWVFRLLTTAPRRAAGTHPVGQGWNIYGTSVVRCRKKIVSWRFWKFFEHPNWSSMIFHDLPWSSMKPKASFSPNLLTFKKSWNVSQLPEMSRTGPWAHFRAGDRKLFARSKKHMYCLVLRGCWGVAEGLLRGWSRLTGWNGLSIGS